MAITSVILFSIDLFIRGNTVTKRSFNEFEVSRVKLWTSYLSSFEGLCDLTSVIAPFISFFVQNIATGSDEGHYSAKMWQRGFFFLLFKSRLLFDITFPAKFGVFANRILRLCRMFLLFQIVVHICTCMWKLTVDVEKFVSIFLKIFLSNEV